PLATLLGRARRRLESALLYARSGSHALFAVLVKGDLAFARTNRRRPAGAPRAGAADEGQALREALEWTEGEAVFYADPNLEETSAGRTDLLPLIEEALRPPLPAGLAAAAERSLARASRV